MEIAKLVLEYIKAVVWPAIAVFGLWRYRGPLQKLIDRIATESDEVGAFGLSAKLRPISVKDQPSKAQGVEGHEQLGSASLLTNGRPSLAGAATGLIAEELALRALEARWGSTIARNWVAELPNGRVIQFDGVVVSVAQIIVIDVKTLTSPEVVPAEVFINSSENVIALRQHFDRSVIAVIALVAPEETSAYEKLANEARNRLQGAPVPILLEFFYLPQLWLKYSGVFTK